MANSYLNKTFSGAPTNAKKGTVSMWLKLSQNDSSSNNYYRLFVTGADGSNRTDLNIVMPDADVDRNDAAGRLLFSHLVGGSNYTWRTNKQLRDMSAFYHLVVAYDTTQASASDRVKIYINGTQETSLSASATIPQDTDLFFGNNSSAHHIGNSPHYSPRFFQGYMSHFAYVDGTALAPTTFGETDSTSGIWKFKSPTGVTWGNNGVHLKFENSGNMGLDSSGNTHNFTVNGNLKQAIDTPSNVYTTMNPLALQGASSIALTNGNLTSTNSSSAHRSMFSTFAVSKGKWYFETKIGEVGGAYPTIGIYNSNEHVPAADYFTVNANGYGYNSNGSIYHNNSAAVSGQPTWTTGDIIGVALDVDNDKVYFSKNGSYINSGNPAGGSNGQSITADSTWYFAAHSKDSGTDPVQHYNFGDGFFGTTAIASAGSNGNGSLFEYDVPSGFYALNTKNLNTYG